MTLIIGIKCSDGLVLGADSAATMSTATGLETIVQSMPKLEVVKDKVIVGVSGPVGLGQLYTDRIDKVCDDIGNRDVPEVCRKLRNEFIQDAQIAFQMAALAVNVLGPQARASVISSTLVALAAKNNELQLIEFDSQCNPEIISRDIAFSSIGIGKSIADPFLALIKHLFWKEHQLPSMSDGNFAVVWTLQHAINTAPSGIRGPIQMAVLTIEGKQPKARKLTREEVIEHEENASQAEDYFKTYKEEHKPSATEPEPPLPPKIHSS